MKVLSTYRLQLHAGFGFEAATAITPYLSALGVTHVYASPYLCAEPGSTHGYNLADPRRLNPEIGSDEQHRAWTSALAAQAMGHIVDIVPNHMGIATDLNTWWQDVLENGPSSLFADRFDIEWSPPKEELKNKLLLPILGAQFGEALEGGDLSLERRGGAFFVKVYERRLPASPPSIVPVLEAARESLALAADDARRAELESIVTGLRHLPPTATTEAEPRRERAREKEILKRRTEALCQDETVRAAIDAAVLRLNGTKGDPRSFDALERVLLEQAYRLSFWRVAAEEINYRRFFEVNDLAAIRMESDEVFDDAHALVFALIAEGRLDGLRLDHTDGLYDPAEYFARLQRTAKPPKPIDGERPLYVVAEKILEPGEKLPPSWRIHGTSGYDFVAPLTGLFVDPASEATMTATYQDFTGDRATFREHELKAKRAIMRASLASEVHMLAYQLERIAARARRSRDFTLGSLTSAIVETIAAFPVYRTYIRPDGSREPHDDAHVERAIRQAKRRNPEMAPSLFDFLREVLLLRGEMEDQERRARVRFVSRFQQLTGPVMAKGVEDTAFYTYHRLVCLNEVGGRPDRYGTSVQDFHAKNADTRKSWPLAMTTTSTHDTKRGEDVRARLCVLSEVPDAWRAWVVAWHARLAAKLTEVDDEPAPSRGDEYLFYQTVVGALPHDDAELQSGELASRISAYLVKAAREAKERTSWISPNEAYETALTRFVHDALADAGFVRSVRDAVADLAPYAATNGLAQVVLKITSPGVPDVYQGSEGWNLALVDPDNRRPVDYARLTEMLARLPRLATPELLARFHDGAIKLFVTRAALSLRRELPHVFLEGSYEPIDAGEHVVAFTRAARGDAVVCVVPRLARKLTAGKAHWPLGDTWGASTLEVAPGRWRDVFTGRLLEAEGSLRAADVFAILPVALLRTEGK